MEQQRASWLANHLQLLQQDHAHLQPGLEQVHQVQAHLQQLQTELREGMAAQRMQQQVCCTREREGLGLHPGASLCFMPSGIWFPCLSMLHTLAMALLLLDILGG